MLEHGLLLPPGLGPPDIIHPDPLVMVTNNTSFTVGAELDLGDPSLGVTELLLALPVEVRFVGIGFDDPAGAVLHAHHDDGVIRRDAYASAGGLGGHPLPL